MGSASSSTPLFYVIEHVIISCGLMYDQSDNNMVYMSENYTDYVVCYSGSVYMVMECPVGGSHASFCTKSLKFSGILPRVEVALSKVLVITLIFPPVVLHIILSSLRWQATQDCILREGKSSFFLASFF